MITTDITADPSSLEIKRSDKHVGYVLWGRDHREPYISISEAFGFLTISEIEAVLRAYYTRRELLEKS